jgi:hypothetical protein
MLFFKDNSELSNAALAPAHHISTLPPPATMLGRMARTYNAVGGLMDTLASLTGIDSMAVLSVWYVESGGRDFTPGRPILRFDNHKFWRYWGSANAATFDRHFRFGGHGSPGNSSKNHLFRNPVGSAWRPFHGDQAAEYEVFNWAISLAGREPACLSASFGGPQIMGFNHAACGYDSAFALFTAFGSDARWQVLGFFDFCQTNGLLHDIRDREWVEFGQRYNGDGATYGASLSHAYAQKVAFEALPRA